MPYYNTQKKLIAIVVVMYFIIGNFTWGTFRLEIYPIFAWELFSLVPNLETDFGLQINAVNNVALDSPTYIQDLPDEFSEANSIIVYFVIQNLGKAIESGKQDKVQEYRDQIESIYFSSQKQVDYEIIKRSYYPRDRWYTGEYEEEVRLSQYDKSDIE